MISNKYLVNSKGIYVFSDPAAENSILAIIDNLIASNKVAGIDFLIYTNSIRDSYSTYGEIINIFDFQEDLIDTVLNNFKPEYVFTGTSSENHEHLWRKSAIKKDIKVISFIDHWTSYTKRFVKENETIFGHHVLVVNEIAKNEAIKAGIPKKSISIYGNPYYKKVKSFVPSLSKINFFKKINIDLKKKLIIFVSDDIKRNFNKNKIGECVLGYDEYIILETLLNKLKELHKINKVNFNDYQILIKLHPKSNPNKFYEIIKNFKFIKINVVKDCEPLTLNYYSDYVIGMFSNMIIESFLMKKKILRIQLNQNGEDKIKLIGLKDKIIVDEKNLEDKIISFLKID